MSPERKSPDYTSVRKAAEDAALALEGIDNPTKKPSNVRMSFFEAINNEDKRIKKYEQALIDAETDDVTGLLNRRALVRRLREWALEQTNPNATLTCIYIDIDEFKEYNDTFGHEGGDVALLCFAEVFKGTPVKGNIVAQFEDDIEENTTNGILREGDFVARVGGDEFVVILRDRNNINLSNSEALIRRDLTVTSIEARLKTTKISSIYSRALQNKIRTMSLSAGATVLTVEKLTVLNGDNLKACLVDADKSMYEAKIAKSRP